MGKKSGGRVRVKQMGPKAPVNPFADLGNIAPEEQIYLPPKPDPNVTQIWPMSATFSLDYSRFTAIWPTYLDGNKTVKMGRRISAEDAIPQPTVQDISEALQSLNLRHAVQPYKGYPRDAESRWYNSGRVLIDLEEAVGAISGGGEGFDADAVPDVDGIVGGGGRSKKALLREIARRIPTLPGRVARLEAKKAAEEEEKKKERAASASAAGKTKASAGGSGGTASKGKKKGKKKR